MSHSVSLAWTASTDAVDGYNIYRGSAAGAENVKLNSALVTATTFVDSAAPLGHDFYVVKSSIGGVESIASNEVNTVILPAPPTGLTITASS
jgi:hypothetical protein